MFALNGMPALRQMVSCRCSFIDANRDATNRKSLSRFKYLPTSWSTVFAAIIGTTSRSARRQIVRAKFKCVAASPPDYYVAKMRIERENLEYRWMEFFC